MTVHEAPRSNASPESHSPRRFIHNDWLEATFQPLAGGRMVRLRHVDHGDLVVPLQDGGFDPDHWPKAGAFPLFPFHNRLRLATFRHDGQLIRLRANSANGADVIHGPAHRRPWSVTDAGLDHVEMSLNYQADDDWPFDFMAIQRFALDGNVLHIDLTLKNYGSTTMPGGIGWHPYFNAPKDWLVLTDAASQWNPIGSGGLPERRACDNGLRNVSIQPGATEHFSDWTQASFRCAGGARITVCATPPLSHVVLHAQARYLCIEPASHVSGALASLPDVSRDGGLRLLEPGASLVGKLTLRIDQA